MVSLSPLEQPASITDVPTAPLAADLMKRRREVVFFLLVLQLGEVLSLTPTRCTFAYM